MNTGKSAYLLISMRFELAEEQAKMIQELGLSTLASSGEGTRIISGEYYPRARTMTKAHARSFIITLKPVDNNAHEIFARKITDWTKFDEIRRAMNK